MVRSGMSVGMNKGHVTAPRVRAELQSRKKGRLYRRQRVCREVVAEICGLAPYERRMIEMLKIGRDKRALKFAKRRLGTHRRAKRKRESLQNYIMEQRAAAKHEKGEKRHEKEEKKAAHKKEEEK